MVQMTGSDPVLKIFTKKWFSDNNVSSLCSENEKTSLSYLFLKKNVTCR